MANNYIHSDSKKHRSFAALLFAAGDVKRWAGKLKQIGWYVGYLETSSEVWFFAANFAVPDKKDLPLRQELTREALKTKGIIE